VPESLIYTSYAHVCWKLQEGSFIYTGSRGIFFL